MNKNTMKGQWTQMKGEVKKQWGKLTDDDLTVIEGQRDKLVGRVQERYGLAQEEAEKQVHAFENHPDRVVVTGTRKDVV